MTEFLTLAYPWVKALHVMAVISWMAGLFYLPRLFVYHAERRQPGAEPVQSFQIMEYKLLRMIMAPAMVVTWLAGLALVGRRYVETAQDKEGDIDGFFLSEDGTTLAAAFEAKAWICRRLF